MCMMKRSGVRLYTMLVALVLALSLVPVVALAEDGTYTMHFNSNAPANASMISGEGFIGGEWNIDPSEKTITRATTFTYSIDAGQATSGKQNIDLGITVHDVCYGENVIFIIRASVDGEYTLTCTNTDISATVIVRGGLGSYNAGVLDSNTYTATVKFDGNNNYNAATGTTGFKVTPYGTEFTIVAEPSEVTEGDTVTIIPTLPVDATGTVKFYLGTSTDGKLLKELPVGESLELSEGNGNVLSVGTHAVTASYSGDPNYFPSTRTVLVTVTPAPVKVLGSVEWNDYDNELGNRPDMLTVHLTADGEKHSTKRIKVGGDGLWVFSFDNLPKHDSQGNEITYDVAAEEVWGYMVEVEPKGNNVFRIICTLQSFVKPTLTVKAKDQTFTYNGQIQGECDTIYLDPAEIAEKVTVDGLRDGDYLESVTLFGQETNTGRYELSVKMIGVLNSAGTIVTSDYAVIYAPGILTIKSAKVSIIADSASAKCDGTALTKDSYTCEGLAAGDTVKSVTITGSQIGPGSSDNVPSAATIVNAVGEDVTDCYEITYVNGKLTVAEHSFEQEVADAKYQKSAATCTEAAVYYKSCSCGEKGTETFTSGDPLGHKWKAATGYAPKTCEICGATEGDVIKYTAEGGNTIEFTQGDQKNIIKTYHRSEDDKHAIDHHKGVQIDGKDVKVDAKSGSVILTFDAATLNALDVGDHVIKVIFDDWVDELKLVIKAPVAPIADATPTTGDSSLPVLWVTLLLLSMAGASVVVMRRRKQA